MMNIKSSNSSSAPHNGYRPDRQPTFQITCAMSFAVFTVSVILPKRPSLTANDRVSNCATNRLYRRYGKGFLYLPSSSSSSYGMNIPDGVLLIPDGSPVRLDDDPDVCKLWKRSWVTDTLSLRLLNALGGCQSISSSSSSSPRSILVDGFDGLKVSWDGEGDNLLPFQNPLLCFIAVSGGSGVSALYFNVVDGNMAIVLLSVLKLWRGVVLFL
jgi:hypothetical protein